jgi:hypothetical protein
MDLSKILSISGKNGLFKMISQTKNNFIVESLENKKRFPAFQTDGVSTLENITIYTQDDSVELKKLFHSIYLKQEKQPLEYKAMSDARLRDYFKEILPDYDEDKVFLSNIKKVYQWYNILLKNDLISIEEEKTDTEVEAEIDD